MEHTFEFAAPALRQLDLIVYLPLDYIDADLPEDEDPELRVAMDARLSAILLNDSLELFTRSGPSIREVTGPAVNRLRLIDAAVGVL